MQHGLDICFDNTTPFYSTTFLETFPTWPKLDNVWGTKSWFKYFRYLESLGVQFGLMGMFPFDSHTLALYVEMCLVYTLLHTPSFGPLFILKHLENIQFPFILRNTLCCPSQASIMHPSWSHDLTFLEKKRNKNTKFTN